MKGCGCCENAPCGCCEGVEPLTPQSTANRPGLNTLFYRVGTHSTFFETMQARLSNLYLESSHYDKEGEKGKNKTYPLKDLRTRSRDDMSIALLDAAATMLDVLTFYQERITNEGYLRTATERRSVLEMARLVGYTLRPGVSASVYLAYTMEEKTEPVEIPVGTRAQSVPAPGELPQSFETSDKIEARVEWNDLKPRALRPQKITTVNADFVTEIYFEGTETNLKPNDPLLFVFEGQNRPPLLRRVKTAEPLFDEKKTKVTLQLSLVESMFKNAVRENIEQYLNNPKSFCVDETDELMGRAVKLLSDVKDAINFVSTTDGKNGDSDEPDIKPLVKEAIELITDINERGNARVQKWLGSLTDELIATFARGIFDAWLKRGDGMIQFSQFMNLEIIGAIDELDEATRAKLIRIIRMRSELSEFVNKAVKFASMLGDSNAQVLEGLFGKMDVKKSADSASAFANLVNLAKPLSVPPSKQPANSLRLNRDAGKIFSLNQDTLPQILTAFNKKMGTNAYDAWANTTVTESSPVRVYALRVTAPLFGYALPERIIKIKENGDVETQEYPIVEISFSDKQDMIIKKHENGKIIYLDTNYDKIVSDTWVIIDKSAVNKTGFVNFLPTQDLLITQAEKVSSAVPRTEYGFSSKTTRLDLKKSWIRFLDEDENKENDKNMKTLPLEFELIRRTIVHTQSEQLELAAESINDDVCGSRVELGFLYEGLRAGRWAIVSGERTDIPNTSGVRASELVMLAGIEQSFDGTLPGDKVHSTLIFAESLAYTYKRDTVRVYGNVVKATHGETRVEVLGSGDATQALQTFLLKQPPLTYVSAPTTSGVKSTLQVRVNDIEWDETDSLAELKPQDRNFITKTDDEEKTTVIFGNGEQGARPPTGIENITAVYRNGIGKGGNIKPEQISLVVTKPLGVKEVINPLRASGGADKETRDQARRNAPIALMALDRLVSTRDYADFARTFAGIGKVYATRLSDGRRELVHLTIAGAEDVPIDINSDLYNNLRRSLAKYGDPFQPVQVVTRELLSLVIIARVQIHCKYLWESVEPKIRAALLDAFSFERRELGQNVYLSEVIRAIQRVEGVAYVDVDVLDSISETQSKDEDFWRKKKDRWSGSGSTNALEAGNDESDIPTAPELENPPVLDACNPKHYISAKPARVREDVDGIKKVLPAQLAYLLPDVPDTLILNRIDEEKK